MNDDFDFVLRYATSINLDIRPRTVFVEGTRDVDLFYLAADLERRHTGLDLLGSRLAVVAAGERGQGGATALGRQLMIFKRMAAQCLSVDGRPKYRFVGLFDYDDAGRRAIQQVRNMDMSVLEFKDVFCLRPVMPECRNFDPEGLRRRFEADNQKYKGLDWELEDLLSETLKEAFVEEFPTAILRSTSVLDKIHRDWTEDGKARLHRYARQYAVRSDLTCVVGVLRAIWAYFGMSPV